MKHTTFERGHHPSQYWCALIGLFSLVDNVRQLNDGAFSWFNVSMALLPYANGHTPELKHLNSTARSVAIITSSIFVLLSTTFYQTLLLSRLMCQT